MNIKDINIIPVVKIEDLDKTIDIAQSLLDGGINVIEITFRNENAKDAISIITKKFPEIYVGAGTVTTVSQVKEAIEVGAKFIVTPGINETVIKYCVNNKIIIYPGCAVPSDIEIAINYGLDVVKFFPAEVMGGQKMIKALSAPYTKMKFIPTGGVSVNNLKSYLSMNSVVAVGGSWIVNKDAVKNSNYVLITNLAKEAMALANEVVNEKKIK